MEGNKNLVHKYEDTLFIICVIVSIIVGLYLLISIVGIIIFASVAILTLFSHAISMAHIQLNGVRLRENQFPDLFEKVTTLCEKMNLNKVPEVYVIESGGLLNAFATKVLALFGKNMVVLYSDFIDIAEEADDFDIDYVIAHELAHIKRNHISKSMLVSLAMWIPFLGTSYLRMAEYTCDRMATYYTEKPQNAINSLLVLAAGRKLYRKVNLRDYMSQYNEKRGLFATLTELLSTHPPIPKRINEIELFIHEKSTMTLIAKTKQIVFISILLFVILPAIFMGIGVGVALLISQFEPLKDLSLEESYAYGEESSPFLQAIIDGDIAAVEKELSNGTNPNESNEYGESALMIAVQHGQTDIVTALINNDADVDLQDDYGWTPLMTAVTYEDIALAKIILDAGADPKVMDNDNLTALDHANDLGLTEFVELLNSY
ncbi:Zn-dependent protease with chaperone function [Metabacillus crassostreae]|uniref:M48 family metallopeptidase n=1 Tax=Metabacillus crassostreae TaxID=929098 RepID=UPI001956C4DC|nr:M48 family metallopeptidase [Metabacillus crassostreae]MBM7602368.1 Zn-dependent protease with chaperone function [Metabacillus crassostreae]